MLIPANSSGVLTEEATERNSLWFRGDQWIQGLPGLGNPAGSCLWSREGKGIPGFSWRSLCPTREIFPDSQGTGIGASVNLLHSSFTECFREIHFHF